jgi:hypothetical protein
MAVTALIIVLTTIGVVSRLVLAAQRALLGQRSRFWRTIVALAGVGCGLTAPARGTPIGAGLLALGLTASASLVVPVVLRWLGSRRQRRTLPQAVSDDDQVPMRESSLTELDAADRDRNTLAAYARELDGAWNRGDMAAVAALAAHIARVSNRLHAAADAVFGERDQLSGAR